AARSRGAGRPSALRTGFRASARPGPVPWAEPACPGTPPRRGRPDRCECAFSTRADSASAKRGTASVRLPIARLAPTEVSALRRRFGRSQSRIEARRLTDVDDGDSGLGAGAARRPGLRIPPAAAPPDGQTAGRTAGSVRPGAAAGPVERRAELD